MDRSSLAALLGGIGFFLAGLAAFWRAWQRKNDDNRKDD